MLKRFRSKSAKRLGDNFISLLLLQGINYLIPLILFPYLIRVLGVDGFGLYSFILAIVLYGVMLTDYGFDLSATRLVSIHADNQKKLNEIFSNVIFIKLSISLIYLLILIFLTIYVDKIAEDRALYFIAYGLILGQLLFPVWFFQGVERMRYITVINGISKLIFTIPIFIFVKSIDDLYLVFLFNSLGAIVAGCIALYIALNRFKISLYIPSFSSIKFYLKDGWYIFTSRVAVDLYVTANVIILGFFTNNVIVGYYSIVEKIVRAIGSMLEPLTRVVFPYLTKVYKDSKELFFKRNVELFFLILAIMVPVSISVFYNSEWILTIVSGSKPDEIMVYLLEILSFLLIFYLYGHQFTNILVTIGESRLLNTIVLTAGFLNIIAAPILIYIFGVVGLVYLNLFIAFFIAFTKGYFVLKRLNSKK